MQSTRNFQCLVLRDFDHKKYKSWNNFVIFCYISKFIAFPCKPVVFLRINKQENSLSFETSLNRSKVHVLNIVKKIKAKLNIGHW